MTSLVCVINRQRHQHKSPPRINDQPAKQGSSGKATITGHKLL